MERLKKIILPLTVISLVSACTPFNEVYSRKPFLPFSPVNPIEKETQETIFDVKKKEEAATLAANKKAESVAAWKKSEATKAANKKVAEKKAASVAAWKKAQAKKDPYIAPPKPKYVPPAAPAPTKRFYPTAVSVPGKPGFVYNPYTNDHVNVKGIPPGKLVRDPDDSNLLHKFLVP